MSVPLYTTLVLEVLKEVDFLLDNYVYDGYRALASYLEAPLGIAVILYVILLGYGIVGGWVRMSFTVFLKSTVKIGLIYLFAMNWSWFSQYVVTLFFNVSSEIGDVIVSATPIQLPSFAGGGIDGAMQSVLIELWDIGQWVWDKGSFSNWGPMFGAVGIWLSGTLLIGLALFEIIIAKCMLSILMVASPLFISFTLFEATRGFFDRWLGLCSSYAFVIIFISAAIALALSIDQWAIADTYKAKAIDLGTIGMITLIFMAFLSVGLIKRVVMLAMVSGSSVGFLASSSGFSAAVAGVLGGTIVMMKTGLRGASLAAKGLVATGKGSYQSKSTVNNVKNKLLKRDINNSEPRKGGQHEE